jgi:hypothetical protein
MTPIVKWLVRTFTCAAMLTTGTECFAASSTDECLMQSELKTMEHGFWAHYPSADEFSHYAAPEMDIATNVVDVAKINSDEKTRSGRAAQLASFLAAHPEYFLSFKTKRQPTYLYYVGNEHSADMMRASHRYPEGQCVSMFRFESNDNSCIAGQRVRALSLSFIKESGRVRLQGAQVAMEACH